SPERIGAEHPLVAVALSMHLPSRQRGPEAPAAAERGDGNAGLPTQAAGVTFRAPKRRGQLAVAQRTTGLGERRHDRMPLMRGVGPVSATTFAGAFGRCFHHSMVLWIMIAASVPPRMGSIIWSSVHVCWRSHSCSERPAHQPDKLIISLLF